MQAMRTILLALTIALGARTCCADAVTTLVGTTMGTMYSIRLADVPDGITAKEIQERVDERLAEINRMMSTYDPKSELSSFNQSTGGEWLPVSSETAKVVAFALEVAEQTDGKFDPTVGPLVNLWGFGPEKRTGKPPKEEAIAETLKRVGYQHLAARLEPPALKKDIPELYVDLSAVAKGYGVDAVAELLEEIGVRAFMVEIGGEVRTRGKKPDGEAWKIGVENPDETGQPVRRVVPLVDESLATSGDYRNVFMYRGKQFSHTIDPTTGRPVDHQLATVTIRAATCMEADACATAVNVLGPRVGFGWAKKRGLAVLMVERIEGEFREQTTPGWKEKLGAP